jgi:hypothetical protein
MFLECMYNILVSNRYTFFSCIKDTRNLKHKFIIEDVSVHTDSTNIALEGLAAVVNRVTCSAPVPGSTLYVHPCHPRGALPAHWACRMFSGPWGIVVVRVSWPGHPTLIKKKEKKEKKETVLTKFIIEVTDP